MQTASLPLSVIASFVAVAVFALPACTVNTDKTSSGPNDPVVVSPDLTPDHTCSKGLCRQECSGSEACSATCSGGGCQQICNANTSCTFTCSGGGCSQTCGAGSSCSFTCSGNGCSRQ